MTSNSKLNLSVYSFLLWLEKKNFLNFKLSPSKDFSFKEFSSLTRFEIFGNFGNFSFNKKQHFFANVIVLLIANLDINY